VQVSSLFSCAWVILLQCFQQTIKDTSLLQNKFANKPQFQKIKKLKNKLKLKNWQ